MGAGDKRAENGIVGFKSGGSWCDRFMRRNCLSVRAVTSVGQKLPADWEEKAAEFRIKVSKCKVDVELSQFGNMDEISGSFDIPDSRTVDLKGKEKKISMYSPTPYIARINKFLKISTFFLV